MATTKKTTPATRKLAVKKEPLMDLSVKKAGPKGGYDTWNVGGLTSTRIDQIKRR